MDLQQTTLLPEQDLKPSPSFRGGFPCQPHSVAGKRKASADERDLWPEFRRVICEIKPRWVVAENVPGLLSSDDGRFFRNILRDFAEMGFDVAWCTYGACDVGAPHRRERVGIVAYRQSSRSGSGRESGQERHLFHNGERDIEKENADGFRLRHRSDNGGAELAHSQRNGLAGRTGTGSPDEAVPEEQTGANNTVNATGTGGLRKELAHALHQRCKEPGRDAESERLEQGCEALAHSLCDGHGHGEHEIVTAEAWEYAQCDAAGCGEDVADTHRHGTGGNEPEHWQGRGVEQDGENVGNTNNQGLEGWGRGELQKCSDKLTAWQRDSQIAGQDCGEPQPGLGGMSDGFPAFLDGLRWPAGYGVQQYDWEPPRTAHGIKHRADRIKCLGNSVVPQQFYPIFKAIAELEATDD